MKINVILLWALMTPWVAVCALEENPIPLGNIDTFLFTQFIHSLQGNNLKEKIDCAKTKIKNHIFQKPLTFFTFSEGEIVALLFDPFSFTCQVQNIKNPKWTLIKNEIQNRSQKNFKDPFEGHENYINKGKNKDRWTQIDQWTWYKSVHSDDSDEIQLITEVYDKKALLDTLDAIQQKLIAK